MSSTKQQKIWIDLDNSPHVPFFNPIIKELQKLDYSVIITARDCFQVCGLADLVGIKYTRIGKHYGKHKVLKILGTIYRVIQLLPMIIRDRPTIAVSHGSRSQHLLAKFLGIPNIIILDYEHASSLMALPPTYAIVPDVINLGVSASQKMQVYHYPGIKEDVYVPGFKSDPLIVSTLGLSENDIIVAIRPPASEAHYRNPESEKLFSATIKFLSSIDDVKMVILPRNDKQEEVIRSEWATLFSERKIIIPDEVVDGLNLIWYSDFVISGGGTMNREAAALGVPVYSIFRGKTGAVDKYLADNGRLTMLESVEDIPLKIKPVRRNKSNKAEFSERQALKKIVAIIVKLTEES